MTGTQRLESLYCIYCVDQTGDMHTVNVALLRGHFRNILTRRERQKSTTQEILIFINRGIFGFFSIYCISTLLHLPPLRFHCVGGCWDGTQDCCDFGVGSQTPEHSARYQPQILIYECCAKYRNYLILTIYRQQLLVLI